MYASSMAATNQPTNQPYKTRGNRRHLEEEDGPVDAGGMAVVISSASGPMGAGLNNSSTSAPSAESSSQGREFFCASNNDQPCYKGDSRSGKFLPAADGPFMQCAHPSKLSSSVGKEGSDQSPKDGPGRADLGNCVSHEAGRSRQLLGPTPTPQQAPDEQPHQHQRYHCPSDATCSHAPSLMPDRAHTLGHKRQGQPGSNAASTALSAGMPHLQ